MAFEKADKILSWRHFLITYLVDVGKNCNYTRKKKISPAKSTATDWQFQLLAKEGQNSHKFFCVGPP